MILSDFNRDIGNLPALSRWKNTPLLFLNCRPNWWTQSNFWFVWKTPTREKEVKATNKCTHFIHGPSWRRQTWNDECNSRNSHSVIFVTSVSTGRRKNWRTCLPDFCEIQRRFSSFHLPWLLLYTRASFPTEGQRSFPLKQSKSHRMVTTTSHQLAPCNATLEKSCGWSRFRCCTRCKTNLMFPHAKYFACF